MITRDLGPSQLGIDDVDLEAVINTEYESGLVNLVDRGLGALRRVLVKFDSTLAGSSTAAEVKLYAKLFAKDGTTQLFELDLVTAIDVNAASASVLFGTGDGIPADVEGGGTIGTGAQLLMAATRAKFGVEVTTAESGTPTSNLGDLRVILQNDEPEQ